MLKRLLDSSPGAFRLSLLPRLPRIAVCPCPRPHPLAFRPIRFLPICTVMRAREVDSQSLERANKRRRISSACERGKSLEMDPITATIELTPIEATLRTLLLDVAQYVDLKNDVKPETVLRFTGGWVRDKLLGVDSHDIDVGISSMTGYTFGMALKEYLDIPENLEKYKQLESERSSEIVSLHKIEANPEKSKHLETVTTKIFGLDIDLVNLRKETYTEDSRNPQMEFGTAQEDAMRRDATINALFYNLNESQLEDFTERGLEDMKNHIIRTPLEPYQTFKDDPLRVLRVIRFASRLGYKIDPEAESAMQNEDIREALKLKISKERVAAELEKMLHGPDPRGALELIDQIGLYFTIFANHQDDVKASTSAWPIAYNSLPFLLHPELNEDQSAQELLRRIQQILFRDPSSAYYAWVIAAFAPWTSISSRASTGPKYKPQVMRSVEVARDSLRSDNKTMNVLRDAALHYKDIIEFKSTLLAYPERDSSAEIRQQVGLHIRSWGKDWRLCIVLAFLQELMQGGNIVEVAKSYVQFLAYIVEHDLEDVCDLKPIVNGGEIMKFLGAKNGPWMKEATTIIMEWQLLHPETSKDIALEELRRRLVLK